MDAFAKRRAELMAKMDGGIAIIPSAGEILRNGDVHFEFRQDSDFFYLTGFDEPESIAVLTPGRDEGEFTLFCRTRDPEREVWDGPRAGVEGATADYGAHEAHPIESFKDKLRGLLAGREVLFYTPGRNADLDRLVFGTMQHFRAKSRDLLSGPERLTDLHSVLHEARLFKTAEELDAMGRAGRLASQAHREAMRIARPGLTEYQVQAVLEFVFRTHGSPRNGYNSIVASGPNATILHHIDNRRTLEAGELLLIDAGCEVDYYTSDITRTFPVNGSFSPAQRDVYDIVLAAQRASIAESKIGGSVVSVHEASVRILTQGMVDLGLLEGEVDALIEDESYKRFYMHRTGHWLGMDVHDVGLYAASGASRPLEPGMVMTVEPGLYISPTDESVPESLRGIGVRIEDDVVVTDGEPINLTSYVPVEPAEIEAICQEPSRFEQLLP